MISVVVPTRNRPQRLERTLRRLAEQKQPDDGFEVIVVDNEHSPADRLDVSAYQHFPAPIRFLHESRPGAAAARNTGVRAASGEVVLFLGDDIEPVDDGFVAGHATFHKGAPDNRDAVIGRVTWNPEGTVTPLMKWLENGVQNDFLGLQPGRVSPAKHFYTGNVSLKKDIFDQAGGFEERFSAYGFEDLELGLRLADMGLALSYDPALLAFHDHPTTLDESLQRSVLVGRSACLFTRLHPDRRDLPVRPWEAPQWLRFGLTQRLLRLLARGVTPLRVRTRAWALLHDAAWADGFQLGPP